MYCILMSLDSVDFKIDNVSLSDRVYKHIKQLILSGQLPAGTRVPEKVIAERFGLSRTPVREALKRLEHYGLVRIKPRSYAQVVGLEADEAPEIAEMRSALENVSIKLLVRNGTEEDFKALREIIAECSSCLERDDIAAMFEYDSRFHLEIARRSGNRHVYEFAERFDAKVQLLRLVLKVPRSRLNVFVGQHEAIIQAAENRDEQLAMDLMSHHVMDQLQPDSK